MATSKTGDGARTDGPGSYASVNRVEMYYEIHGEGRPMVLLHGALGTIESCFAALLPALAATRRVIAVELQGHGHTADIERPLSFEHMAEDVYALLGALGLGPLDLVGYSMGGGVALQLAIRHPEAVGRIVFAGGTSYRRDGLYPEMLGDTSSAADELDGSVWHRSYIKAAPDPNAWSALVRKVSDLDRTFEGWSPDAIRALRPPILLVIGDSDIVRPEHTMEMFRLLGGGVIGDIVGLPASQLAVLPGTSHVGVLDRVEWLRSMTAEFLDSRP
jgi:pimeloyl-ACP methyl ester carboxylesterase